MTAYNGQPTPETPQLVEPMRVVNVDLGDNRGHLELPPVSEARPDQPGIIRQIGRVAAQVGRGVVEGLLPRGTARAAERYRAARTEAVTAARVADAVEKGLGSINTSLASRRRQLAENDSMSYYDSKDLAAAIDRDEADLERVGAVHGVRAGVAEVFAGRASAANRTRRVAGAVRVGKIPVAAAAFGLGLMLSGGSDAAPESNIPSQSDTVVTSVAGVAGGQSATAEVPDGTSVTTLPTEVAGNGNPDDDARMAASAVDRLHNTSFSSPQDVRNAVTAAAADLAAVDNEQVFEEGVLAAGAALADDTAAAARTGDRYERDGDAITAALTDAIPSDSEYRHDAEYAVSVTSGENALSAALRNRDNPDAVQAAVDNIPDQAVAAFVQAALNSNDEGIMRAALSVLQEQAMAVLSALDTDALHRDVELDDLANGVQLSDRDPGIFTDEVRNVVTVPLTTPDGEVLSQSH